MAETIFLGPRRREPFLRAMAFPRQMASSPRFCGPSLPRTGVPLLASNRGALRYLQGCAWWRVLLMYRATAAGWLLAGCWLHGRAGLAAYL